MAASSASGRPLRSAEILQVPSVTSTGRFLLLSFVLHGPPRTSGASRMVGYEFGRGSPAQLVQVATVQLRNLLLDPIGERLLRSHEPPQRLCRVFHLHASQDHVPTGHPDEVNTHAADAQVPSKSLVFAEVVLQQILGEPPPVLLHVRQDGQNQDGLGRLGISSKIHRHVSANFPFATISVGRGSWPLTGPCASLQPRYRAGV